MQLCAFLKPNPQVADAPFSIDFIRNRQPATPIMTAIDPFNSSYTTGSEASKWQNYS